jgi:hypothetical protein
VILGRGYPIRNTRWSAHLAQVAVLLTVSLLQSIEALMHFLAESMGASLYLVQIFVDMVGANYYIMSMDKQEIIRITVLAAKLPFVLLKMGFKWLTTFEHSQAYKDRLVIIYMQEKYQSSNSYTQKQYIWG